MPRRSQTNTGVFPHGGTRGRGGTGARRTGEPDPAQWSGLGDRDRRILAVLDAYKVLTTNQLAALEFPSVDRAQHRLSILWRRGLVWRWRPTLAWGGSAPHHYALGYAGAKLLAAQRLADPPRPGAWETRLTRLAESPQLRHLLGINQFFCDLVAYAKARERECVGPERGFGGLTWWLSEAHSREWIGVQWDEMARPDGIGCFEAGGRMVRFFLEYDTGTESHQRLLDKVQRYERMLTDRFGVVLFWFHSAARETAFHRTLARFYREDEPPFVIASGSRDHGDPHGPAGAVWAVYGAARAHARADSARWRVRLADLPERGPREHWPSLLDMPFTEAAMPQLTIHQLRYGMTAEQMQARGLDPGTGQPWDQPDDEPDWDDDPADDTDKPQADDNDAGLNAGRSGPQGDDWGEDDPIVRGAVRPAPQRRTERPRRTPTRTRDGLIDIDTGQPVEPASPPSRQPRGPQGQPWPSPRLRDR